MKISETPIIQLILCNLKVYLREPEAIFWTYGFPLLMVIGLGTAFSGGSDQTITLDIIENASGPALLQSLQGKDGFKAVLSSPDKAFERLRKNKTALVVESSGEGNLKYHFDDTNPESRRARDAVDTALQEAAGRTDALANEDILVTTPGSRYVDFLVPGLIGMNLMGGGLWGIGFVLVDLRVKGLLKRLLGTPMKRAHFLLSMVGSRAIFFIPEALFLLGAAYLIFGVPIAGSLVTVLLVAFTGAMSFAGMGLLAASRARRIETISGLMNLIMLPMWLCSGIFFSSERFPGFLQPFIQALPLTQLINALRAVILEGDRLQSLGLPLGVLALWGGLSFVLALKWFRWN